MQTGLFFNETFNVLMITFNPIKLNLSTSIKDYSFIYKNKELVGINIFNVKTKLKSKINIGINNDNLKLIQELNRVFKTNDIDFVSDKNFQFVVGKITKITLHKKSKKLNICDVSFNGGNEVIVCGAPNVKLNALVVVAKIGSWMSVDFQILPSKLLDVESNGMLCSDNELGIEQKTPGIKILDNKKYKLDDSFWGRYYE